LYTNKNVTAFKNLFSYLLQVDHLNEAFLLSFILCKILSRLNGKNQSEKKHFFALSSNQLNAFYLLAQFSLLFQKKMTNLII